MEEGKREGGLNRFTAAERDSIARFVQQVVDSGFLTFFVEYCTPDPETPGDCVVMWDGPVSREGWSVHKSRGGCRFLICDPQGRIIDQCLSVSAALKEATSEPV